MPPLVNATERFLPALLLASMLPIVYGIKATTEVLPLYWHREVVLDVLYWAGGSIATGLLLHMAVPRYARSLLLLALLAYLISGAGLLPALAVLLFFFACWCLGHGALALAVPHGANHTQLSLPLLTGLALQLALFGLLIHFPVNHPALYLLLQGAACLALPRRVRQNLSDLVQATRHQVLRDWFHGIPLLPFLACILVLGAVARYALFPSIGGDDNAVHLRLWTELSFLHRYSFNVVEQIWAVAPFGVDLLHAIVSLIAGSDARGALNLCLYALICRQLWVICRHWSLPPWACLFLLALFSSTPLVGNLLITLHTELFMGLLASAGVRALLELPRQWYSTQLLAVTAIAALCAATKVPGMVLGLMLLGGALIRLWPLQGIGWTQLPLYRRLAGPGCVLAFAVTALHSYTTAWWLTGNPLFPLYNGIFQSPWNDPVNFSDGRWIHGFSLASYWQAFFRTSSFYEARDFVAGFHLLLLPLLGTVTLLARLPLRQTLAVLLPLLGYGLAMFSNTQYWRYLFPVMPLAVLVCGSLLLPGSRWRQACATVCMTFCLLLNLWFYPGVSYTFEYAPGLAYTAQGRELITQKLMPEQALTASVNARAPGSTVLYQVERPFGATLQGSPWYPMWYAPGRRDLASTIDSQAALQQTLRSERIDYVIWNLGQSSMPGGRNWLLRRYLADHALPLLEISGATLYDLHAAPSDWRQVLTRADVELPTAPASLYVQAADGASAARISALFQCSQPAGSIMIELGSGETGHWMRRQLDCRYAPLDYRETFPLAPGLASVTLSVYGAHTTATAATLEMELH